ncbi:PKD domain-containing protein [Rubripirellula amarantea]|nr:PKD domain-containing protein [Rubripirellula amarantea]
MSKRNSATNTSKRSTARRVNQNRRRKGRFERLEDRRLMAADLIRDLYDINSAPAPNEGIAVENVAYFANKDLYGSELWKSDGTVAGTQRVMDIREGSQSSSPKKFVAFDDGAAFIATSYNDLLEFNFPSVWVTDGTEDGTKLLAEGIETYQAPVDVDGKLFFSGYDYAESGDWGLFQYDPASGDVLELGSGLGSDPLDGNVQAVNGKLFFTHADDVGGVELWVSDGTESGTKLLKDIQDNATAYNYGYGSNPGDFTTAGGLLFFTATQNSTGKELWVSDGTEGGTFMLKDIHEGIDTNFPEEASFGNSSVPHSLTEVDGTLFFIADDGTGNHLWKTEGTAETTIKLSDVDDVAYLTEAGGTLFFTAYDEETGTELWSSDGTVDGTALLKDIRESPTGEDGQHYSSHPETLAEYNGQLLFFVSDQAGDKVLYRSNGTAEGTVPVITIDSSSVHQRSIVGNAAGYQFFTLSQSTQELWRTDGTANGTVRVQDNIGGDYFAIGETFLADNFLFFTQPNLSDLFVTEGGEDDTIAVTSNFESGSYGARYSFEALGQRVTFTNDGIWISDGTSAGTVKLADHDNNLGWGVNGSHFAFGADLGNGSFVFAGAPYNVDGMYIGAEPWVSDGTPENTNLLVDIPGNYSGSRPFDFQRAGGDVYFTTYGEHFGYDLWKTDGTELGTELVTNPSGAPHFTYPGRKTAVGDRLYFVAQGGGYYTPHLWTIGPDGGNAEQVLDVLTGEPILNPGNFIDFNGKLALTDHVSSWTSLQPTPWIVDEAGATQLSTTSVQDDFELFEGELYFASNKDEIWKTNGEVEGTVRVVNLTESIDGYVDYYSKPGELTAVGDQLFFTAIDDAENDNDQVSLWALHDGVASTIMEFELVGSYGPFDLTAYQDKLIFFANDGVHGIEPWISDGTAQGTELFKDIHPILGSGSVRTLQSDSLVIDEQLFFVADDGITGDEPWRITLPIVEVDAPLFEGDEADVVTATGRVRFAETIEADFGNVVDNGDGTWTWTGSLPDGPANQIVTLTATDSDDFVATTSFELVVNNVKPIVVLGDDFTVAEGAEFELDITNLVDPGLDTVTSWTVDWGDGSSDQYTEAGIVSHIYTDGMTTANISVSVEDEDGSFEDAGSSTVTIENVPPTIVLSGESSVDEGRPYMLTLGDITDPGDDVVVKWTVDWGDGNTDVYTEGGDVEHVYADGDSSMLISVTLEDEDGIFPMAETLNVDVINVKPTIELSGDFEVNEGATYSLTLGEITDPGEDTVTEWIVDWGDGTTDTYTSGGVVDHVYSDGDSFPTIFVTLLDDDGTHQDVASIDVSVLNVAPSISISGASSVIEGGTYTLTFVGVTDPGDDLVDTWFVDWGDGNTESFSFGPNGGTAEHVYADGDSASTISVGVEDEDGLYSDLEVIEVFVINEAPTTEITGDSTVNEGATYSLTLGDIVDAGDDTVDRWTVNWGDGNTDTYSQNGLVQHTYADGDITATILVTIEDEDGIYVDVASKVVEVLNVAPQIAISGPDSVAEGVTYTLNLGAITDPGVDTVFSWTVNWGDGTSDTYTEGGDVQHTYTDDTPSALITVGLEDEDGIHEAANTITVEVTNTAPSIELTGDATVLEGSTYSLALSEIIDLGDDTVSLVTVNWGDGMSDTYDSLELPTAVEHVYQDNAPVYNITVELTDEDGDHTSPQTLAVEVINAPPTIDLGGDITLSGVGEVNFSRKELAVTDPGLLDTHTVTVDYGDGSDLETFALDSSREFQLNHIYRYPGVYTLSVSVDDQDGGIATDQIQVTADVQLGFALGDTGRGIAVADNATGVGYIMYSAEIVQERFTAAPPRLAAQQLVAVRNVGGQWQYNDNNAWFDFEAVDGDRLLASVDFDSDTIATLHGSLGMVAGIASGYTSGDLDVFANQYNGKYGLGEFTVSGSHFVIGGSGQTSGLGELGGGIAVKEDASGTGYLMYSKQSVHDRFVDHAPRPANADHVIAVQYADGQWSYNNDLGWFSFDPAGTDRLLAAVDFDNDTATSLENSAAVIEGIIAGYPIGDLTFTANEFRGVANVGEFSVSGTFFENRYPGLYDIGDLKFGVTAQDNGTGTGYLMYTAEDVQSRFAANRPSYAHSSNLIMVRFHAGAWQYDNNTAWVEFTPTTTDRLLADVDFDNDTIVGLMIGSDGELAPVEGISVGYVDSDLAFFANQYKGRINPGDFEVSGTFFTTGTVFESWSDESMSNPDSSHPSPLLMSSRLDVTGEGNVTALDALQIVNHVGMQTGESESVLPLQLADRVDRLDVNGDDKVSALDALLVINALARQEFTPAPLDNGLGNGLDADEVDEAFADALSDWQEPSLF